MAYGQAPVALKTKLGYAIGDLGLNLHWQAMTLFLAYFQTDVQGVPPVWVGVGFLVAAIADGLANPLMGVWADRTSTRLGRYRPFILWGGVPLGAVMAACFTAPGLGQGGLIAYAILSHMAWRGVYTIVSIPYASLSARITQDAEERSSLTGYRMTCAFIGGITVSFLLPALATRIDRMATGGHGGAYGGLGYSISGLVVGTLSVALFWLCASVMKEEPYPALTPASRATLDSDVTGFLRTLGRSGPLMRLLVSIGLIQVAGALQFRNLVYFFKYDVGDMDLAAYAMPAFSAASAVSVPFWVWLSRRTSKKVSWQMGTGLAALSSLAFLMAPSDQPALAVAAIAALFVGCTVHAVGFWAMLPDLVDYNEWRFGRRDEAKIFGVASLAQKVALGLAGALLGWLLSAIGFVPNATQSAETLSGLRLLMSLLPCGLFAGTLALMAGYPLDGALHRRIVEELGQRAAGDVPPQPPMPASPLPASPLPANHPGAGGSALGRPGVEHQARGGAVG
ncbi:GPH family glycoside/pentoside/hexuronide:cation symporter [Nitrospirillum amazonense]|uniref:GPH family glycoside/pentoside/hexuronide:cation symporter n=1 Tax=Nitrospirillum amazonense TaxID=28077 RepID=A0A560FBU0_9PROT|nr:glycoside-pentoside-hexuronide (GPH):cation symporter [Nitrospirillum amazonense]TWB19081.1 GPH family glycoside/pentoside/hexuronide:cation symporter [Nitrospirillum amazonense]